MGMPNALAQSLWQAHTHFTHRRPLGLGSNAFRRGRGRRSPRGCCHRFGHIHSGAVWPGQSSDNTLSQTVLDLLVLDCVSCVNQRGIRREERGAGTQKVCVSKMARSDFPNGKFRFLPRWSLWSGKGGGGWHKALVSGCLPLAAPIGLSPLLILTLCGSERVLVVSAEPPDDLTRGGGGAPPTVVSRPNASLGRTALCISDAARSSTNWLPTESSSTHKKEWHCAVLYPV